jgi:hypothetical protein
MSLLDAVSFFFDKPTMRLGRELFDRGSVTVLQGTRRSVVAVVHDGADRHVSLSLRGGELQSFCSCSAFVDDADNCEHLVAACLAAGRAGHVQDAPSQLDLVEDEELLDQHLKHGADGPKALGASPGFLGGGVKALLSRFGLSHLARRDARPPSWDETLARVLSASSAADRRQPLEPGMQVVYVVDLMGSRDSEAFVVEIAVRTPKAAGGWAKLRNLPPRAAALADEFPDPDDRRIVSSLVGAPAHSPYGYVPNGETKHAMGPALAEVLVPAMARTGRLFARHAWDSDLEGPLELDDGEPWDLALDVIRDESAAAYRVARRFVRGGETRDANSACVLGTAWVLVGWRLARLRHGEALSLAESLAATDIRVPLDKGADFVDRLLGGRHVPRLELPEELRVQEVVAAPAPALRFFHPDRRDGRKRLHAELSFLYEHASVPANDPRCMVALAERRLARRDAAAERRHVARLASFAFKPVRSVSAGPNAGEYALASKRLPDVVRTLTREGWHVEAEGKLYRSPRAFRIDVTSGIDWFDLAATADFDGVAVSLPKLLAALRRGEDSVVLDDGSIGMLPEKWLAKWGSVARLGATEGDAVRFRRSQAGLLDALLAASPEASCDEVFRHAREELATFDRIAPEVAPPGFVGSLRGYQCDGLGWLTFLERFGFGGCLADDMGLGKTIQALAVLERRRELRASAPAGEAGRPGPSIVVAPRSLIFNWKDEAARFAPKLRVLDYTGTARLGRAAEVEGYDVLLTTYGTLRRDAAALRDIEFDYAILDEAQAIKNASTDSAKAARLLRASHRLALSGTPVENHIGELWSLFEFLNPGMLGGSSAFAALISERPSADAGDVGGLDVIARALRPFVLRRTKERVATDLPSKTEQTVYCELDADQRKLYDELRDHYRASLLGKIEHDGMAKSTMHVLEALLRLRQAACHPGLVDPSRVAEPCAKLDALVPQLTEIVAEGSKALVFSQFTSLLAILRRRLDDAEIRYEYLDGRTRDRAARVDHFQTDPECRVFLISLKAGGLGLNLTAAEYVFLLDPWWNPAVEAQAIDRVHRIGQTRACFAYRLIARDTVEEKVVELQRRKRALAEQIVNADANLVRSLTREDLETLLA